MVAWNAATHLIRPWVASFLSACPVPFLSVVGMRLRGSPATLLIQAYISLHKQGVETSIQAVEVAYMTHRSRIRTPDDLAALIQQANGST
jgi:uncharacterized protein YqfA (UPF0365 family)